MKQQHLLNVSQLSRLGDVPVSRIRLAIDAGKLRPRAVNRIGSRKNFFFDVADVAVVKNLFAFDPQPVC